MNTERNKKKSSRKKTPSPLGFYNREYYERHEFGYRNEESEDVRQILELLRTTKKDSVLEVGCGLGVLLAKIPAKNKVGTEINDFAVNICRKQGLDVINANIESGLPFKNSTFDIIIMNQVIAHLRNPQKALKESYRLLKPGGKILITAPIRSAFFHDISETHLHEMTLEELSRLIKRSNFSISAHRVNGITFLYPLLENVVFRSGRLFKSMISKKKSESIDDTREMPSLKHASFIDNIQSLIDRTLLKPLNIYRERFLQFGINQLVLAKKPGV